MVGPCHLANERDVLTPTPVNACRRSTVKDNLLWALDGRTPVDADMDDTARHINYSAREILEGLNQSVIGQIPAKRDLSTLLAMHLLWSESNPPDMQHTAPNALIIGPTGVGKTHAIRTAAEMLGAPLAIVDATQLSHYGLDQGLEGVLYELLAASRRLITDPESARRVRELEELDLMRRGIVFIDEFDKLAVKDRVHSPESELIQRRLLQFMDGTVVTMRPSALTGGETIRFDTAGLLFVVAGAFSDLLKEIGARDHARMRSMLDHNHVIAEDLVAFGFMKELVARIPVIIEFSQLTDLDLAKILETEAVDPSLFYKRYLEHLGSTLEITPEGRAHIAKAAARLEIGARGLHQVLFPILALLGQKAETDTPHFIILDAEEVEKIMREVEERRSAR